MLKILHTGPKNKSILTSKCLYTFDNTHSHETVFCPNYFANYTQSEVRHFKQRAKVCGCFQDGHRVFSGGLLIFWGCFHLSLGWLLWVQVFYSSAPMTTDAHFLTLSRLFLWPTCYSFLHTQDRVSLSFSHQSAFQFHFSQFFGGRSSGRANRYSQCNCSNCLLLSTLPTGWDWIGFNCTN